MDTVVEKTEIKIQNYTEEKQLHSVENFMIL